MDVYPEYANRLYLGRNQVEDKRLYVSLTDMNDIRHVISFMHAILFEEYIDKNAVFEEIRSEEEALGFQVNLSEYMVEKAEQEKEHFSFQRENEFFEYLVEGKIDIEEVFHLFPGDLEDFRDLYDGQGVIAESQKKSAEYTAVSFITLLTRHVIAAGVNETEAYMLSDVSLQKLSKAKDMIDMERICRNSIWQFIQILKEHNKTDGGDCFYIEQSKDYVAKHIFEKISLQEVADYVGIHPAYLSRLFSKHVGVGILNYILQEKIHISCNLLKYSGKSIAIIAEYVNLSPQSYFSKVFKKVMNQTPAQYRKEHRNIKF